VKETHGFVLHDPDTNSIILAIRGTQSLLDILDDVCVCFDPYENMCPGCKVHRGFHERWESAKNQVIGIVEKYKARYPKAKLILTGHSLGGAVIAMAAGELSFKFSIDAIYTFGQPRVGNKAYSDWLYSRVKIIRVTHNKDPVPTLPFSLLGYKHQPLEIFYDVNWRWKQCDLSGEDPTCTRQYGTMIGGIPDHSLYYNISTDQLKRCSTI